MTNLGECLPNAAKTSTLHHAKLVSKVYKLHLRQRLDENVRNLLIYGYVLELQFSLLHHVADEVLQEVSEAIFLYCL